MRLADPVLGLMFSRLGDAAADGLRASSAPRTKRGGAATAPPLERSS